jgi:hypothetical protein
MAVLELRGKVLACEVVVKVDEYSHVCARRRSGVARKGLMVNSKKLKIRDEETAMHELDDRPKRVQARARTPFAEDRVCGVTPRLIFMSLLLRDWTSYW